MYRIGYYYVLTAQKPIAEDNGKITGLSFDVVFRIYDKEGNEIFYEKIDDEDNIPHVLVRFGAGFTEMEVNQLYAPRIVKDEGLVFVPVIVDRCDNPTGYQITNFYKEVTNDEGDFSESEISHEEFTRLIISDAFNYGSENDFQLRCRLTSYFGEEVKE